VEGRAEENVKRWLFPLSLQEGFEPELAKVLLVAEKRHFTSGKCAGCLKFVGDPLHRAGKVSHLRETRMNWQRFGNAHIVKPAFKGVGDQRGYLLLSLVVGNRDLSVRGKPLIVGVDKRVDDGVKRPEQFRLVHRRMLRGEETLVAEVAVVNEGQKVHQQFAAKNDAHAAVLFLPANGRTRMDAVAVESEKRDAVFQFLDLFEEVFRRLVKDHRHDIVGTAFVK